MGSMHTEGEISRRKLLAMGGAAVAAGTFGPWIEPLSALGATSRWPTGGLSARDAVRVKGSQFMPVGEFLRWNHALDRIGPANQKGLRATGSPSAEHYIDTLRNDLERARVKHLHFEKVPFKRWTTTQWSLDLLGGPHAGPVKTASYVPYTGPTPPQGVTGQLVLVPTGATPASGSLAGKIAVVDVPITVVPLSFFTAAAYPGTNFRPEDPSQLYKRPYLNGMTGVLDALDTAGAAGVVAVIDFPAAAANGSYSPTTGSSGESPVSTSTAAPARHSSNRRRLARRRD